MKLKRVGDSREFDVEIVSRDGDAIRVRLDGREIVAQFSAAPDGGAILTLGGHRYPTFASRRKDSREDSIAVAVGPASFEFKPAEDSVRRRAHGLAAPEIVAPMPGKVLSVMVRAGDLVEAAQPLVVIEAMKMETTLAAESAALVKRVLVETGQMVDHGAVLIELSPPPIPPPASSTPRAAP